MKKLFCFLALAATTLAFGEPAVRASQAVTQRQSDDETIEDLSIYQLCLASIIIKSDDIDVSKWRVGDTMQYDVSHSTIGRLGDSTKKVVRDEGIALWVRQSVQILFHKEVVEVLVNKADGRILKILRNGKEQPPEDNDFEVIKKEYDVKVKVPAGEFSAIYIKGKMSSVQSLEAWASPDETLIDGSVKQVLVVSLGTVTFELKNLSRGNGSLDPEL